MKTKFLLQEAVQALRSSVLRSLLTIVGIVVGITSVTAMLALGAGLSANVLDRFTSFATGDVTVSGEVTMADVSWIRSQPYVTDVLGTLSVSGADVLYQDSDYSPTVQAVVGDYVSLQSVEVVSGDLFDFNDAEYRESVAVVSDGFADSVLEDTGVSVLGDTITIGGQRFTVIGIIESSSMSFTRGDGVIIVPYRTAVGMLTSNNTFSSIAVMLQDSSYYQIAGQHLLAGLNTSRQLDRDSEDVFSIETAQSIIETAEETTQMLSTFLGVIGGIALFVGGIGTMNMMLTTVTERTKEIGLRKAVGARDRDIMMQILVESVFLTSLGGAIGILLTLAGARVANTIFADSDMITILVNAQVIVAAAVVSVLVGVVFGLYPARNASKLQPVDALRSE